MANHNDWTVAYNSEEGTWEVGYWGEGRKFMVESVHLNATEAWKRCARLGEEVPLVGSELIDHEPGVRRDPTCQEAAEELKQAVHGLQEDVILMREKLDQIWSGYPGKRNEVADAARVFQVILGEVASELGGCPIEDAVENVRALRKISERRLAEIGRLRNELEGYRKDALNQGSKS